MAIGMIKQYPITNKIGAKVSDQKLSTGPLDKEIYPKMITSTPKPKI